MVAVLLVLVVLLVLLLLADRVVVPGVCRFRVEHRVLSHIGVTRHALPHLHYIGKDLILRHKHISAHGIAKDTE